MHSSLLVVVSSVRCFVQILVVFCTGGACCWLTIVGSSGAFKFVVSSIKC